MTNAAAKTGAEPERERERDAVVFSLEQCLHTG